MNTLPINTGDTAFMILCTAMVCLMTPGLAFYGGLARKNNILTIMSQSFLRWDNNDYVGIWWIRIGLWTGYRRCYWKPGRFLLMRHVTSFPTCFMVQRFHF